MGILVALLLSIVALLGVLPFLPEIQFFTNSTSSISTAINSTMGGTPFMPILHLMPVFAIGIIIFGCIWLFVRSRSS